MTTNTNKRSKKVWLVIGIVLAVWCLVSVVATKFIYDGIFTRYETDGGVVPDRLQPMVETRTTVVYPVGDHTLTGHLYRPETPTHDTLLVLAPGFHACADEYLWQIADLLDRGWTVFSFDPTGHCHSGGESGRGFPQELVDLEETVRFLRERSGWDFRSFALIGHSRGGYAACCAAGEDGVVAVVSVSGINSAMEGIMSPTVAAVGPLAYGNYPFLWAYQTVLFGGDIANREAVKVLSDTDVPTLLVHGQADEQIPLDRFSVVSHAQEIENPGVRVMLCSEEGQNGHTNLLFDADGTANDALMEQIHRFLEENVG